MAINPYLVVKALHLVSVISWMAGMLYLPRLYVYHCGVAPGSEASSMLKTMERRLLRFIINPAMMATFGFGFWLVAIDGPASLAHEGWFHIKMALVAGMVAVHILLARWRRDFELDRNVHSAKFYRIMNEVPTVLMIVIVLLAVVKPF